MVQELYNDNNGHETEFHKWFLGLENLVPWVMFNDEAILLLTLTGMDWYLE
jgi:hypothetical protein